MNAANILDIPVVVTEQYSKGIPILSGQIKGFCTVCHNYGPTALQPTVVQNKHEHPHTQCCRHTDVHTEHTVVAGNFVPIISTALGHTVSEIDISRAKGVFDKTVFSMVIPEVQNILDSDQTRKSVVLFGIEVSKYVCV